MCESTELTCLANVSVFDSLQLQILIISFHRQTGSRHRERRSLFAFPLTRVRECVCVHPPDVHPGFRYLFGSLPAFDVLLFGSSSPTAVDAVQSMRESVRGTNVFQVLLSVSSSRQRQRQEKGERER